MKTLIFDCEVYKNYFLVAFKLHNENKFLRISTQNTLNAVDRRKLYKIFNNYQLVGFNSKNYDIAVLLYAFSAHSTEQIYNLSCDIIENGEIYWKTYQKYDIDDSLIKNHIDIFKVAPALNTSLKTYAARLFAKNLQDLPYDPHSELSKSQIVEIERYCENDLIVTELLLNRLGFELETRRALSQKYNTNMHSLGDAKIAENVLKYEYESATNTRVFRKQTDESEQKLHYNIYENLKFKSEQMLNIVKLLENSEFSVTDKIKAPKNLTSEKIKFSESEYQLGLGGLHSQESERFLKSNEDYSIVDADVSSYYPSLILNNKILPKGIRDEFLDVYQNIVTKRLAAKNSGDKLTAASLKLVVNSIFGKLKDKYSWFYDPKAYLQVVITGQLSLLLLIERLEFEGISVVSANTDGVTALVHKTKRRTYKEICAKWSNDLNLNLEFCGYKQLLNLNVNNYFALTKQNEIKRKGFFTLYSLTKNPVASVVYATLVAFFTKNVSFEDYIDSVDDFREFVIVRKCKNGAQHRNNYLGKTLRWYYSTNGDSIHCVKTGNKVATSDNAIPVMQLPDKIPKDLHKGLYLDMVKELYAKIIKS
jgi:DNA polymerase elongation subunit (family B)